MATTGWNGAMGIFPYRSLGEFQTALFQLEPVPPMETTYLTPEFETLHTGSRVAISTGYLFDFSTDLQLKCYVCYSSTKLP